MNKFQKFSVAFVLALTLHLSILALFGMNFTSDSENVKQKQLPEIIQASMLDDDKILEEAHRLKTKEENKQFEQQKKQEDLKQKRKKEQELLQNIKSKRLEEEKKTKVLEEKRKQEVVKAKQRQEELKKNKAIEAARLAKIKLQKEAENKRLEKLRKEKEKKVALEKQAEKKRQKAILAKKKAVEAAKAAEIKRQKAAKAAALKRQQASARAKSERDRNATVSATAAIQQRVNTRWIKPQTSKQGLSCTIRVKLLPSGDVMEAKVVTSSGDNVFDRSAENAVRKASPLPVPKDRALFIKHFRRFTFEFKPE